jgi:hypothetical protein
MPAYNIVRMRVKSGREQDFLDKNKQIDRKGMTGFRKLAVVKTGERSCCIVGEWDEWSSIAAARPTMIGILDSFRDMLEDLGGDLGVTDPVSGEVLVEID